MPIIYYISDLFFAHYLSSVLALIQAVLSAVALTGLSAELQMQHRESILQAVRNAITGFSQQSAVIGF